MTATLRSANPHHRPDKAIADLHALMNDQTINMKTRVFAALSASRVEPLGLTGGPEPPSIVFLRNILTTRIHGQPYNSTFRQQAATALAYWERRAKQAALKFAVDDNTEQQAKWRRILNGCIRAHLAKHQRWPQDKHLLIANDQPFDMPSYDPDLALNALLLPINRQTKSRRKLIDQPDAPIVTSDKQHRDILTDIAHHVQQHLKNHLIV